MLTRRRALATLGAAGIGNGVFQRALAAKAADGPVSPEMVADAEWVAGIKLIPAQREAAANHLNKYRESLKRIRAIELDNSQRPGLIFRPLTTPESLPDPRGYQPATPPKPVSGEVACPNSDEELAFASIRQLGSLLRSRKISSVELTKLYFARLRRYDPLLKCVVTFMDELALEQAKRADRELAEGKDRGALHGIPWGMKDIIAYPGYPTTWCAPQYRDRVINVKAAVAERLDNAGAVLIAKLATNPFAGGGVEWYRGLTRCPWNPHYVWPSSRDISTIRVGYSPENGKDEDREELRVLRELGIKLVPIRKTKLLDDYGLTFDLIEAVVAMEGATSFDELTRRGEPKGIHGWPRYWAYGHLVSAVDYLKISRLRAILMERLEKLMQTIDIYLGDELGLYTLIGKAVPPRPGDTVV